MPGAVRWFQLSDDIQVDEMGRITDTNRHPARMGSPFWVLALMGSGTRSLRVGEDELRLGPHDFMLLPPGEPHTGLDMDTHDACYVHLLLEGKERSVPRQINSSQINLPMRGHLPSDIDLFEHMNYCIYYSMLPYASKAFIAHQLRAVLYALSLDAQRKALWVRRDSLIADEVLTYIREHLHMCPSAQDYEREFNMSYHHLNLMFKSQYKRTIKQMHQLMRMDYASMLVVSGRGIADVARACGYDDYFYFLKSFKKHKGITVRELSRQTGHIWNENDPQ